MMHHSHPEQFYRSVFDEINDAVLLYEPTHRELVEINRGVLDLFGYDDKDDFASNLAQCFTTEGSYTAEEFRGYLDKALAEGPQLIEWKAKGKDGQYFWVELNFKTAELAGQVYLMVIMRDISRLKRASEELVNSEARFRELAETLPEVVYEIDTHARLTFCNNAALDIFGLSREDFERGINVVDHMAPEERKRAKINIGRIMQGEIMGGIEYTMIKKDGTPIPVMLHGRPIIRNGRPVGTRGVIVDISRLKKNEQRLQFLSYHDSLTKLYNRYFFEQKMHELVGAYCMGAIILCDVDGLKIINDSLGHAAGDKVLISAAGIIARSFRKEDVVARIGGDEFAVLLTDVDLPTIENGMCRIKEGVKHFNSKRGEMEFPLSLSMGMAYNASPPFNAWDLFKEADDNMYRQKLYQSRSTRSAIVQTLMKALEARDFITEGHADRLRDFVSGLATELSLSENKVTELCLLAQFHDIGKVGIPDRILFKKGIFTPEEYAEMQRHSEIGYRIAESSPDLSPIAEWILKHHEWWNGNGYPLGLKGEEIPLECRILAIADAYDAMTNDRPYRKRMTHEEAMEELKRCAGSQFDPFLVEMFIKIVPKLIKGQTG